MKKLFLKMLEAIYKKLIGRKLPNGNTYYWGKGSIVLVLVFLMAGCLELKSRQREIHQTLCSGEIYYTPNGCEYYIYKNQHGGIPVHKQDCKKCSETHKRELIEIIKALQVEQ